MTDEDTRIVNHALACLPNQWQDEREAARAALHRMFRRQVKAEKELERLLTALEPFASGLWRNVSLDPGIKRRAGSDVRRARAALSPKEES